MDAFLIFLHEVAARKSHSCPFLHSFNGASTERMCETKNGYPGPVKKWVSRTYIWNLLLFPGPAAFCLIVVDLPSKSRLSAYLARKRSLSPASGWSGKILARTQGVQVSFTAMHCRCMAGLLINSCRSLLQRNCASASTITISNPELKAERQKLD